MKKKTTLTTPACERAYRVQLWALAEERCDCGMTDAEFSQRAQEIWDNCFEVQS